MTRDPRLWRPRHGCTHAVIPRLSLACIVLLLTCSYFSFFLFTTSENPRKRILLNDSDPRETLAQEIGVAVNIALSTMSTLLGKNISSLPGLNAYARRLQEFLHCSIKQGVLPTQVQLIKPLDSNIMLSNASQNSCLEESPEMSHMTHGWTVTELCSHLFSKRILLVGSRTTYVLHDKLIDLLPSSASGSQSGCPGATFCTWHEICLKFESLKVAPVAILPSTRHKIAPRDLTNSAVLRFALATTLHPRPPTFPVPYVSPLTGVREYDAHDWPEKARRADLLVLAKAPVPAPAWAYGNASNASFAVRVPFSRSSAEAWTLPLLEIRGRHRGVVGDAWRAMTIKWLPELVETLVFLSKNAVVGGDKLVVWLGSKFTEEGCAWSEENIKSGVDELRLEQLLRSVHMADRCVFQNAQVHIEHQLLKEILPYFSIFYIPEANPAFVKMKPQASSSKPMLRAPLQESRSLQEAYHPPAHPVANPPTVRDQVFLDALVTILRWRKSETRSGAG